jgi:formylmethanofuran dehydrogenase subunit E
MRVASEQARCERCGRLIDSPNLVEATTGLDLCLACAHPAYEGESVS